MSAGAVPAPTANERAGMDWWNSLSESDRAAWLAQANSAKPSDAWATYRENLKPARAEIEAIVDRDLRYGDRRSAEYRAGAIDMVCRRTLGSELSIGHAAGTAQWDAYMAGVDRGWMIWKSIMMTTSTKAEKI